MCGEYQGHSGREVRLTNARQIFRWASNRLTLVDFARVPGEVRLSATAPGEVVMLEASVEPEVQEDRVELCIWVDWLVKEMEI
jgi:hypothetical protein